MCGIAGILKVWPAEQRDRALATPHVHAIPEAWLDILDDSIKHRGPDGLGRFRDRAIRADGCVVDVAFVHRRLSIIDHAGGHQPMLSLGKGQGVVTGVKRFALGDCLGLYERDAASELGALSASEGLSLQRTSSVSEGSDRVCVIFNGCNYNHRELRAELEKAGHVFSTDHSDTEVLVHGWREWGTGLRDKVEGMFACLVWDKRHAECLWMRDDFGEKPLACWDCNSYHIIASTNAAVVRVAHAAGLEAPPLSTDGTLRGWVQFGWNQVGPWESSSQPPINACGYVASKSGSGVVTPSRWCQSLNPANAAISSDEAEVLLRRAVHSRLEADVPLGCFLSGGIDSALVVKFAAEVRPDIEAFTVRMPDLRFDESRAATQTASHLRLKHMVLDCDPSPAEDLQSLVAELGLPFGDSSLLPSLWVSRAAARRVRVALSGDGGDEMFLGYQRHQAIPWLQRLERLPRSTLDAIADALPAFATARSRGAKAARLLDASRYGGYKELVAIFPSPFSWQLGLCEKGRYGWGANTHFGMTPKFHTEAEDRDMALTCALRFDRMFYLPEDLLRKSDTASMHVGLEVRAPFLGRALVTACMDAPRACLMPRNQRKGLLRQVARKYLPSEIVDRPKMGFAIPIGEWFRSDYGGLRAMLLDHLNSAEPFGSPSLGIDLNMTFVKQMLDEHLGTGPSGRVVRDHSQRLYMLLVLSIWAKWLSGLSSSPYRRGQE